MNDAPEMVEVPRDIEQSEMIGIPIDELKTLKNLADALSTQNNLTLQGQEQIVETLRALIVELGKQETIVIPPSNVTMKASDVIPNISVPPAQITVIEREGEKKVSVTIKRDRSGVITGFEGTIK